MIFGFICGGMAGLIVGMVIMTIIYDGYRS